MGMVLVTITSSNSPEESRSTAGGLNTAWVAHAITARAPCVARRTADKRINKSHKKSGRRVRPGAHNAGGTREHQSRNANKQTDTSTKSVIICLHFTGPLVLVTARVHSTPPRPFLLAPRAYSILRVNKKSK
eukprot:890335-Prorocentrum_minimum.AAC.3